MYAIIVGGGNVGLYLAKRLLLSGHEVVVLERDSRQAQRLAVQLGDENVVVGDGCEMLTQKEAGFGRADVVVAVTGEDEDNLVVCQMAKVMWQVDRVVARVNDPNHVDVFSKIGIDEVVSATGILHALIEQQISPDVVMPVGALAKGNVEVVEVELGPRSPAAGKLVRELTLPPQTNIVWIIRDEHGLSVTGDTRLLAGDMLVALISQEKAPELRELLAPARV